MRQKIQPNPKFLSPGDPVVGKRIVYEDMPFKVKVRDALGLLHHYSPSRNIAYIEVAPGVVESFKTWNQDYRGER